MRATRRRTRLKQAARALRVTCSRVALKILRRSLPTLPSWTRQSMASQSGTSSGPFTVTVSNLPFGWGGLISISVQRLTCPRQRPFGPSHQGWYPASYPGRSTEGSTMSPRVSCRLSTTGIRLLGILLPPRSSAPLTVGLPEQPAPGPDGISTFRTSESRPDWVPSLPRGPAVLTRPVRSLRSPLAPTSRGQALSPRSSSHLRSYPLRGVIKGLLAFTRPAFPLAW